MNENATKCSGNHRTYRLDKMIIVPSPASIWDYPYVDQLRCTMGLIYEAGPDSQREFFPSSKNRIPSAHMENSTRFEPSKCVGVGGYNAGETELSEVKIIVPTSSIATSMIIEDTSGSVPCGNGGCKTSKSRPEPRQENPWHILKTIFLISVIVALVVWVIIYTLLAQYGIL